MHAIYVSYSRKYNTAGMAWRSLSITMMTQHKELYTHTHIHTHTQKHTHCHSNKRNKYCFLFFPQKKCCKYNMNIGVVSKKRAKTDPYTCRWIMNGQRNMILLDRVLALLLSEAYSLSFHVVFFRIHWQKKTFLYRIRLKRRKEYCCRFLSSLLVADHNIT